MVTTIPGIRLGPDRDDRLHRLRPARLLPRHPGPRRPARPAGVRAARSAKAEPPAVDAGHRTAERPARKGRAPGLRRELRTHGAGPARSSARRSMPGTSGCTRPASRRAAAGSRRRPSVAAAGWRTSRSSPACGWTTSSATTTSSPSTGSTLTDAFGRAGWRTLLVAPAIEEDWPEGTAYYHYDKIYDARNVGYAGPRFSWATMPDQFTLAAFQRLELGQGGPAADHGRGQPRLQPLALDADTPVRRLEPLGDGSIFDPMAAEADSPEARRGDTHLLRAAYGQSIAYSLDALTSFVQRLDDPNLVLVVLGDHQPSTRVSGEGASRDVPISIIAADPAVTDRAASWGWQAGLRPERRRPGVADGRLPGAGSSPRTGPAPRPRPELGPAAPRSAQLSNPPPTSSRVSCAWLGP